MEAFRSAKDPIVVQVLRRNPPGARGPPQEVLVVDVCTQTDITFEHIMALAKLRPTTPPVPDVCPFLLSDRYVDGRCGLNSERPVSVITAQKGYQKHCMLRGFKETPQRYVFVYYSSDFNL